MHSYTIFHVMRTFKIFSLSDVQKCNTVLLTKIATCCGANTFERYVVSDCVCVNECQGHMCECVYVHTHTYTHTHIKLQGYGQK